ncbi:MAG TPA: Holliday junction branch migration protein RuvA [Firmicutes bacterium]|nr:Holliday junction branch migration protein RuvA [Bacillota bacterium]
MYAFIEGEIIEKSDNRVIIKPDGMGVGLIVNVPPRTSAELPPPGGTARLYTSFRVSDDSHSLYGFGASAERDLFEALMKISGIGGKTAVAILDLPRDRIISAIAAGDSAVLQQIPSIGAKTAARIVLELKDRFAKELMEEWAIASAAEFDRTLVEFPPDGSGHEFAEAVEALCELGYSRADARELIRKARAVVGENCLAAELVRHVLKHAG